MLQAIKQLRYARMYKVFIALYKKKLYVCILIYTTSYRQLSDNVVTFCDKVKKLRFAI